TIASENIDIARQNGKVSIGFLVTVNPQSKARVIVDYTVAGGLGAEPLSAYQNYYQKQSGTQDDQYTLVVKYPEEFEVIQSNLPLESSTPQEDYYQTTLKSDQNSIIEFIR